MRKYLHMCVVVAGLAFLSGGCVEVQEPLLRPDGKVTFGAAISVPTKAGIIDSDGSNRPLTDVEGIQILRGEDGDVPAFNEIAGVTATGVIKAGEDELTPSPSQHYPLDAGGVPLDEDINFVAWYPAGDSYTPGKGDEPAKVYWGLKDGLQDIICSAPAEANYYEDSKDGHDVLFEFSHALARLRIKVVAEDEDSRMTFRSVTSAVVKVPTEVTMYIDKDGKATFEYGPISDRSSWKSIDFCRNGEKLEVAWPATTDESLDILIPPIKDKYSFRFSFEGLGEIDKDYEVADLPLEAGKTTVLTITVKGGSIMLLAPFVESYDPVIVPSDGKIVIE